MVQFSLNFAGVNSVSMRDSLGSKEKLICLVLLRTLVQDGIVLVALCQEEKGEAITDSSLTPTFLELKRAHETYLSDCPQNISLWLPQGSEP